MTEAPETPLEAAMARVRSRAAGRTRYEDMPPYDDELMLAEVERLRRNHLKAMRDTAETAGNRMYALGVQHAISVIEGGEIIDPDGPVARLVREQAQAIRRELLNQ